MMKKILLVAATESEVEILIKSFIPLANKNENVKHFNFEKREIDVIVTGVGMVATTFHLARLELSVYDLVVNVGIAGSYNRNIAIGQSALVISDCFAELGADFGEKFVSVYQMDFSKRYREPFMNEKGVMQNDFAYDNSFIEQLPKASAVTVNMMNVDESRIKKVLDYYSPDLESMEGAAVFYTCMKQKVPCLQIRSVSNYIEPRTLSNWNIPFAISSLNKLLKEVIQSI